MKGARSAPSRALRATWFAGAAVYLLVGLEWLFLVTKPSMFTVLGWPQRIAVLLAATLITAVPVAGLAALVSLAWGRLGGRWRDRAAAVGLMLPAAVLSAAGLLVVENFTKTVFGFNVGSFTSPLRYLYAAGWLLLAWRIHRRLRLGPAATPRPRRVLLAATALVAAASLGAAWVRYEPAAAADGIGGVGGGELPNILILSSDGLNATNMSVYGYRRRTTPFLDSLADEFLLSENHFTNSTLTTASVGALLSGKLPMDTGVLRGGHAFGGRDVFQHLPGLLRQLGYYNIDVSARVYGDAYDMNIRQGFHVANGRSFRNETLPVLGWLGRGFPSEVYFLGLTTARLRERLLHAVGWADMKDHFDLVARKATPEVRDAERVRMLGAELERAPRPFFAQVHLYDTHRVPNPEFGQGGPRNRFIVRMPHFSARGAEPDWRDRYDDTILAFDDYVERIVTDLEAAGELDRTVLIINSDHGERREAHVRLPLLFRFPRAEHRGRIVANTQRIDIAPTILSYLGVDPPDWMAGRSLLGPEPDPLRRILVTGEGRRPSDRWLALIQCHRSYVFHVKSTRMVEYQVRKHTARCGESDLLGTAAARRELFAQLDVSGLLSVPFAMQLASLQLDNNPEMRQQAIRSLRRGQPAVLWLGDTMAISNAHSDFWTNGTKPAAILVRNESDEPRSHELLVSSGEDRRFPAVFHVQDERQTREFSLPAPGAVAVALSAVPPGSDRLFLVWSDAAWTGKGGTRQLGVKVHLAGAWLRELLRGGQPARWTEAARTILARRVPAAELDEGWLAANVHRDLWTRGGDPAGLAVRNDGGEPLVRRLLVRTGKGHQFPLLVLLDDGGESREIRFAGPGSRVIDLPPVPPRSERLFIVRSERGWMPESGLRELGVRLAPAEP